MPKIKAITFDLWDTVFMDDTDEPKRKAAGRPSKPDERRQLVKKFLEKQGAADQNLVNTAYDTADAAFNKVWKEHHITWEVRERLSIVLKGLGRELPDSDLDELVRLHEEMELEFRPDFAPGVHQAISALSENYKLGVISDTIFSPGTTLRKLLEGEDLLKYFQTFTFSDEFGMAKPQKEVFLSAAEKLGVKPEEMVHIGDRESNDIRGPIGVGARGILCTVIKDRGSGDTSAAAVFSDYTDLPGILADLEK
jgi:putative hydrolase of the HAD superfamily